MLVLDTIVSLVCLLLVTTVCVTKKHVDILYSIDGYMERKENFRTHDEPVVRATDLLLIVPKWIYYSFGFLMLPSNS